MQLDVLQIAKLSFTHIRSGKRASLEYHAKACGIPFPSLADLVRLTFSIYDQECNKFNLIVPYKRDEGTFIGLLLSINNNI